MRKQIQLQVNEMIEDVLSITSEIPVATPTPYGM